MIIGGLLITCVFIYVSCYYCHNKNKKKLRLSLRDYKLKWKL